MSSNTPRWDELNDLLDQLLEAPSYVRDEIIAATRKKNTELADRASVALALAERDDAFPSNACTVAPELLSEIVNEDLEKRIGTKLGPYVVTSSISYGGMGMVYRGERADGSYDQAVAIKFVQATSTDERSEALFDRERRLLAQLEHPNIVRIIDAGITTDNDSYYVMELVDGDRIDDVVRTSSLEIGKVLQLFLQVCDAVSYCHQSLVVHGDIKPENILIASDRARLVDFGIGQSLDEADRPVGDDHVVAYSPGYAAPEQRLGSPISVASDIYAMGALLEHLLSINSSVKSRRQKIDGDLHAITRKCMADQPADRYRSVDALQRDIQSYLRGYPVSSVEQTPAYLATRFMRRNRLVLGSIVAIVAALIAGLSVSIWQYRIAQSENLRATQVKTFLVSLIGQANPTGESDITLRRIVDDAAERIASELTDAPGVRGEIELLLGNAYFGFGDFDKAYVHHRLSYEHLLQANGGQSLASIQALNALGADLTKSGDYAQATEILRESISHLPSLKLEASSEAVVAWTNLGNALAQPDSTGSIEAMHKAHAINQSINPDDTMALTRSLGNIAVGYRAARDIVEATRFLELALAMSEENKEKLAPDILTLRCNLALNYGTLGLNEKARERQTECNRLTVERLGANHSSNVANLNNLGALDIRMGLLDAALETYSRALYLAEQGLPPKSLDRLAVEINHSVVLWHRGSVQDAEKSLRDILLRMQESVGRDHAASGRVRSLLGRVVFQLGQISEAEQLIADSFVGLIPYWRSDALLWQAEVKIANGDREGAIDDAEESLAIRRQLKHYTAWQVAEAEYVIALAQRDADKIEAMQQLFIDELPSIHFRRTAFEDAR